MRERGLTEGKVALWSSVIFGAVHISNALGDGDLTAPCQAIAVSFAGYFFYLTRRASGGNVVDCRHPRPLRLSILSGTAILADQQGGYVWDGRRLLAYVLVGVLLIVRRHRIEPEPAHTVQG